MTGKRERPASPRGLRGSARTSSASSQTARRSASTRPGRPSPGRKTQPSVASRNAAWTSGAWMCQMPDGCSSSVSPARHPCVADRPARVLAQPRDRDLERVLQRRRAVRRGGDRLQHDQLLLAVVEVARRLLGDPLGLGAGPALALQPPLQARDVASCRAGERDVEDAQSSPRCMQLGCETSTSSPKCIAAPSMRPSANAHILRSER